MSIFFVPITKSPLSNTSGMIMGGDSKMRDRKKETLYSAKEMCENVVAVLVKNVFLDLKGLPCCKIWDPADFVTTEELQNVSSNIVGR
ncbi:hypothetical protein PIB30_116560 [Stylosanthes scabra]|uniref:Uncharacterized protein n=1 Tax=Stylosanthes scabra TaxID=79078 RepID=A0ABU6Q1Z7_9FABA|nr:hypothetical protein [Stylosanthes scabra]